MNGLCVTPCSCVQGEWMTKMGSDRTVKEKHVDNSWLLVGAIKRCKCIPRTLLKNGKHARDVILKRKSNSERRTTDVSEDMRIAVAN